MRQQYHSKKIGDKTYVWDVHKLVERAKDMPIIEVPLDQISELNDTYWHEEGEFKKPIARDIALHAKLIYECDLNYPIILHADGSLMDGMHRCCKALIEGRDVIRAVRFETDPPPDYIDPDWAALPYKDDFYKTLKAFGLPHAFEKN